MVSSFLGRFDGRWTLTRDLDAAARFAYQGEAHNARQALLQEADDRVARSDETRPAPMWWDLKAGLVVVREVEQVLRVVVGEQGDARD